MRTVSGIILVTLGLIVLRFGGKQFGKYGRISKVIFSPSVTEIGSKINIVGKKMMQWTMGLLLIYFGIVFIFNKLNWIGYK
ncbi:MAG: hypothetical protein NTY34_08235 [Candidatus Omnitrophica bacterium]|nr:hypothetical protein [Candidatus Omnitrophota bacterium]